jgi:hypothetical protein
VHGRSEGLKATFAVGLGHVHGGVGVTQQLVEKRAWSTVERAVERYYRYVRLPENVHDTIRAGLRAELDKQRQQAQPEIAWAKRRVVELEDERRRLARGVGHRRHPRRPGRRVTGTHQEGTGGAGHVLTTAEVTYGRIEETLNLALSFVGRCDELYRRGGPQIRRLSNQCFFEKLLVDDEEVAKAVYAEPPGDTAGCCPAAHGPERGEPRLRFCRSGFENECFGAPNRTPFEPTVDAYPAKLLTSIN